MIEVGAKVRIKIGKVGTLVWGGRIGTVVEVLEHGYKVDFGGGVTLPDGEHHAETIPQSFFSDCVEPVD